jgi:Zn-dependent protease with chaperone function
MSMQTMVIDGRSKPNARPRVGVRAKARRPPIDLRRLAERLRQRRVPSREDLLARVNELTPRFGHSDSAIEVVVSPDLHLAATAQGLTLGGIPTGTITVSTGILRALTTEEIDFVLGHEITHIARNHLFGRGLLAAVRAVADALAVDEPGLQKMLVGYDIAKLVQLFTGELPMGAALTKDQETEADARAVFATGNPTAARSVLRKLAGQNLDGPSHLWEVFDIELPVMSIRERLTILDATLRPWFGPGV